MKMTILTYNLNGIRSALQKGLVQYIKEVQPDIFCIQESKAQQSDVPAKIFEDMGYHAVWHSAQKKGYSGVVTFSRQKPSHVVIGCGIEQYDNEGRILRTDFDDLTVLNCYFPSGSSGDERQAFKIQFLQDFYPYVQALRAKRPKLIVLGDFNIAHTELDIHSPKTNQKTSGFLPAEREWMTQLFSNGFTDSFRHLHPTAQEYSWWSTRFNSRAQNKGWRIDYIAVTDNLQSKLLSAGHLNKAYHSDHCAVFLQMEV